MKKIVFMIKISNFRLHLLKTFILKVFQTEKLFFINKSIIELCLYCKRLQCLNEACGHMHSVGKRLSSNYIFPFVVSNVTVHLLLTFDSIAISN